MISSKRIILFIIIYTAIFITSFTNLSQAQEPVKPGEEQTEDIVQFMEDGMQEIDFYSLEELLDVEVEVASLFEEDELVVGSTVSSISSEYWKRLGARRVNDALANELSVVTYDHLIASDVIAIRGYVSSSLVGTAFLLDGVPLNDFLDGKISYLPDFGLGTLERIELIKGPGSAIYGSDAFNGVIAMKSFESKENYYFVECAGAYPLYGDASARVSEGFADNLFRVNFAASTSGQAPREQEYKYRPEPLEEDTATWTREPEYKSNTGVFKLNINPSDKLEIKLGSYIYYGIFEEYPGIVKNWNSATMGFEFLNKNDTSSQETLFVMEKGSAIYTFGNKISVEGNAHFHKHFQKAEMTMDSYGSKDKSRTNGSRSGANLIIKQPDNAINLQWLIAYSFAYMKANTASIKRENWNPAAAAIESFGEPGTTGEAHDQLSAGKDRTINSAYAQTKWGIINNSLYLILGGRLDHYSDYGNQVTPRGGLIFLPTKKSSIKALYGRAFRAATGNEIYGINGIVNPNKDLEPETIDIYELIFMHKEKKWKLSLNGFYSKWKNGMIQEINTDYASFLSGDSAPVNTVNKGENEAYGGEAGVFYAFDPFAVDLGLSWVKSKALDISRINPATMSIETFEEENYVAFPRYIVNAGFYYTLKPYNINFFLNNRFMYKMKETHYNMSVGMKNEDLPLYWRTDLNVNTIISERAELILDIHNLLNRENYKPSVFGSKGGIEDPGISVMLRAGYKF